MNGLPDYMAVTMKCNKCGDEEEIYHREDADSDMETFEYQHEECEDE